MPNMRDPGCSLQGPNYDGHPQRRRNKSHSAPVGERMGMCSRYELESFVCEGEYRQGLDRILSAFLTNISQPQQQAVWVSGFYGSGKSHLVRVLEYLWRDVEFPEGARARSLVTLPSDLRCEPCGVVTIRQARGRLVVRSGHSRVRELAPSDWRCWLSSSGELNLPEQYPAALPGYMAQAKRLVRRCGRRS